MNFISPIEIHGDLSFRLNLFKLFMLCSMIENGMYRVYNLNMTLQHY